MADVKRTLLERMDGEDEDVQALRRQLEYMFPSVVPGELTKVSSD